MLNESPEVLVAKIHAASHIVADAPFDDEASETEKKLYANAAEFLSRMFAESQPTGATENP